MTLAESLNAAARAIGAADALLITAGAGMGVDSGMPDFRGPEGFWRAYPPYQQLGLRFEELANPFWFANDPALAWGFYGHRLNLYRATMPHRGFQILKKWGERARLGFGVFTSNVDGHFQKAGFPAERIHEVHGSIHHLQCQAQCGTGIFSAEGMEVEINPDTLRAREPWPQCPACGGLARPNVLMFGDWDWDSRRSNAQEAKLENWLRSLGTARLVVVECGAGLAIPTVRRFGEQVARSHRGALVRINIREPEGADVGIPLGALEALQRIDAILAAV